MYRRMAITSKIGHFTGFSLLILKGNWIVFPKLKTGWKSEYSKCQNLGPIGTSFLSENLLELNSITLGYVILFETSKYSNNTQ